MIIAAQRRGLEYALMEHMTLGQIVDYCVEYDRQMNSGEKKKETPKKHRATQAEINAYFGS